MGRADARLGSMSSTGDEALVSTVVQQVTPANSPRRTEQDLTPPPILRRVRSTFGAVGGGVTTAAARDVSTSVGGDDAALSTATSEIGAVGCLQRAWRRARASLIERVNSGALAVLLVANLGIAGKDLPRGKPNAEVRQRHIHTTVHHAAQRAAFLMVNEYGWGSDAGPEGTRPAVQQCTGLTLTTRSPGAEPPPLQPGCSCWCYAAEEQVFNARDVPSTPGFESSACRNFIAARHTGAFALERMPTQFWSPEQLPPQAFDCRRRRATSCLPHGMGKRQRKAPRGRFS